MVADGLGRSLMEEDWPDNTDEADRSISGCSFRAFDPHPAPQLFHLPHILLPSPPSSLPPLPLLPPLKNLHQAGAAAARGEGEGPEAALGLCDVLQKAFGNSGI